MRLYKANIFPSGSDHTPNAMRSIRVPLCAQLKNVLLAAVCTTLVTSSAYADDSEVFFREIFRVKEHQPNVLFVMDTSWSMAHKDEAEKLYTPRIDRLKNAMSTFLNEARNVNVGVMRINGEKGGGGLIYPVASLDEKICLSGTCGEESIAVSIDSPSDDVEQISDSYMNILSNKLTLADMPNDEMRAIGLRFNNVNIPQGAMITSAELEFHALEDNQDRDALWRIRIDQDRQAEPWQDMPADLSTRELGDAVSWQPTLWDEDEQYQSPDLTKIIQPLVDRQTWCGGKPINIVIEGYGRRAIAGYDHDPAKAATLKISYDSSNIPHGQGCMAKSIVSRISNGNDDSFEAHDGFVGPGSKRISLFSYRARAHITGLRFVDIPLPPKSKIIDAFIEFEVDKEPKGESNGVILGEATDFAERFWRSREDLSRRLTTEASVDWTDLPMDLAANDKIRTPNIGSIVQEIVDRPRWQSGNALAFLLKRKGAGMGRHAMKSYNGEPTAAPKLMIRYQAPVSPMSTLAEFITPRELVTKNVNAIQPAGNTPIVDTLYEASLYMTGRPVDYGKHRGRAPYSSPRYRVAHPLSYIGGQLKRPIACAELDLNGTACAAETIAGNPEYISPLNSSCQTNHIVLLSDGEATSNSSATKIRNMIGLNSCSDHVDDNVQACGTELAQWLATTDHKDELSGKQTVLTSTIGFNIDHPFLKRIAKAGGGQYFRANTEAELTHTFKKILMDVQSVESSFVAPVVASKGYNRLTHRQDIYFAAFKPDAHSTWSGNLKRYQIGLDEENELTIFDHSQPRKNAVNRQAGTFDTHAKSDWSTMIDGTSVNAGGAAEQLKWYEANAKGHKLRPLYTYLGNTYHLPDGGVSLRRAGTLIHESKTDITRRHLGINEYSSKTLSRDILLQWARGVDVMDADEDGERNDMRQHMGDPMHSQPVIVNYANEYTKPDSILFVGTNEGVLHFIDTVTGTELFSFMPQELLPNIKENFSKTTAMRTVYGLDGPISTWINDKNRDKIVDADESAMLFVGMRRGGKNYYAFDISDRLNPKLAWTIQGGENGTPGFENLGQTWSRMQPTKLRINGESKNVLIFGGGYDESNDINHSLGMQPKTSDVTGNAIYIVELETGKLLYSLGDPKSSADHPFKALKHAIPSDIRVLDINTNGFADALFVGDMGGQVWRFDFDPYHHKGALLQGGVLADLGKPHTDLTANRRFFYPPDVAITKDQGKRFLSISMGSGWRSHPLNTKVQDRFYTLRSPDVYVMPKGYGKRSADGHWQPLLENDLTDLSDGLGRNEVGNHGWMLSLNRPGEKVMGAPITVDGHVVFTTYLPNHSSHACVSSMGAGAVYSVNVTDASPSLDLNLDGFVETSDRSTLLNQIGVPPPPTPVIFEGENGNIHPTILIGTEQPLRGLFSRPAHKATITAEVEE